VNTYTVLNINPWSTRHGFAMALQFSGSRLYSLFGDPRLKMTSRQEEQEVRPLYHGAFQA
jgi:hypothetical protein